MSTKIQKKRSYNPFRTVTTNANRMTSEKCRAINCPYFYKFSGKAACKFTRPKKFLKHMDSCPLVLKN